MTQMNGRLLVSGAACAIALTVFGVSLVDAMSADRTASETAPVPQHASVTVGASKKSGEVITMQAVNEAVAMDPFSTERQPPATPYRLPGDPVPDTTTPPAPPAPPPLPAFRLVGTTQTSRGGIALIQVGTGDPTMVSTGETMNGFVLDRVDPVSATMKQGDRQVDLKLQQPLANANSANGQRNQNGRANGGRANGASGRAGQGRAGAFGADAASQQKAMLQQMQDLLQKRMTVDVPVRKVTRDTTSPSNPRSDR